MTLELSVGADNSVCAQRRNTASGRRATSQRQPVNYSAFSHATKKHQQACNSCHKVPSSGWQKASDFPDITDYPGHDACVACHRSQFFRGVSPIICSVCHTRIAPRADARWEFAKRAKGSQFSIEFPHDKHQDVIAVRRLDGTELGIFRNASFNSSADGSDPYNNCTVCHSPRTSALPADTTHWPDKYLPDALTFKTVPSSHASCFNCHWKAQAPTREKCDGCHKPAATPVMTSALPARISLKFKHEGGGEKRNHVAECTTCHINITKSASLRGLKPDVPITSCTECHNKDGLRLDVSRELAQIDKNKDFVCVYCHTSDVGRRDPPAFHYLVAGREPVTRKNLK